MTNNKQQTAVDIALKQINQAIIDSKNPDATTKRTGEYRIGLRKAMEILENLKEMEKEQMEDAWLDGNTTECDGEGFSANIDFEQWFNETYGGNK